MLMDTGMRLAEVSLSRKVCDMRASSCLGWMPQGIYSAPRARLFGASWSLNHGALPEDIGRLDTGMWPFSTDLVHVRLPEALALMTDFILSSKGEWISLLSCLHILTPFDLEFLHSILTLFF